MPTAFTIYNCGTGYNRSKNDVVARLSRETNSPQLINDGPGSGGFTGTGKNPGGKSTIGGLFAGTGVDANVDSAVKAVKQHQLAYPGARVNMCGWSRGAVTCFKIAHELLKYAETKNLDVAIFAIDPVPGGGPLINDHMWRNVGLANNVVACRVILAQHDRRALFAPVYPTVNGPFADIDIMPGDHSTIVEAKGDRTEAHEIVYNLAKWFLRSHGTNLSGDLLAGTAVLSLYAQIAARFDDYEAAGKGLGSSRPIRDEQGKATRTLKSVKPAFFLNEHHRDACSMLYPRIVDEIDRPAGQAFRERLTTWHPELVRMRAEAPKHADLVDAYIAHVGASAVRPRSNDVILERQGRPRMNAVTLERPARPRS